MTSGAGKQELRALASVAEAREEERVHAHAEAVRDEARAARALADAEERVREAREAVAVAAAEPGTTAAERAMREALCARLRERVRASEGVVGSAVRARDRAAAATESARAALQVAQGERRAVETRIDRAVAAERTDCLRREDDDPRD